MKSVVIVGAGVIGLMCALRLSQRGAQVVVLEGEKEDFSLYGPTASLAAAGMLAPISEMSDAPDAHPGLDALALESFDLWRTQSKGALWEDGVRFEGGIVVAGERASALQTRAAALGRSVMPVSSAQWRKRSGFRAEVANPLLVEDEGVADPIRVLSGLAMDARRHGVRLLFAHDVDAAAPDHVTVFDHGRFDADIVLLAPGAWASERMIAAAPALAQIRPARGHIAPVIGAPALGPNIHGPGFYLARRGGDELVLGATMEFDSYDRHVDPARVQELLAAAERTLPGEVHLRAGARPWVGVRPMSPDSAPMIGPSGDVLVACGHSRNGWLLAPVTAEIICAHVFGEPLSPLWAQFAPDRFR